MMSRRRTSCMGRVSRRGRQHRLWCRCSAAGRCAKEAVPTLCKVAALVQQQVRSLAGGAPASLRPGCLHMTRCPAAAEAPRAGRRPAPALATRAGRGPAAPWPPPRCTPAAGCPVAAPRPLLQKWPTPRRCCPPVHMREEAKFVGSQGRIWGRWRTQPSTSGPADCARECLAAAHASRVSVRCQQPPVLHQAAQATVPAARHASAGPWLGPLALCILLFTLRIPHRPPTHQRGVQRVSLVPRTPAALTAARGPVAKPAAAAGPPAGSLLASSGTLARSAPQHWASRSRASCQEGPHAPQLGQAVCPHMSQYPPLAATSSANVYTGMPEDLDSRRMRL